MLNGNPYAIARRAIALALPAIVGVSTAIADDNCAPCAQARSQTVRLLAQAQPSPTPRIAPSGQSAGVPSCQGGTGPCWPSQYTGPCFPQIQPRWIEPPRVVNVTPQSQIPGANAPCQPCQSYPSFYCPPTLAPARPAIPLQVAGKIPLARAVPYESLFPSSQTLSSPQARVRLQTAEPEKETAAPPPETPTLTQPPSAGAIETREEPGKP